MGTGGRGEGVTWSNYEALHVIRNRWGGEADAVLLESNRRASRRLCANSA